MMPKRRFIGWVVVATEAPNTQNRNDETDHRMRQPSKSLVCKESSKRLTEKSLENNTRFFLKLENNDNNEI